MISAISTRFLPSVLSLTLALSPLLANTAQAQSTKDTQLPEYVIAEYGTPPAVPDGPLSKELQAAVQVAFVDSVRQSAWNRDQMLAMEEIAASGDPRLGWLISDLMRFVPQRSLNAQLAEAASLCLEYASARQGN